MSLLIIFGCIVLLILLITYFKINAFLSFLIVSILAGFALGMELKQVTTAVQKGIGDMLGGLVIVVVCGAMLGKITADSGAAQRIASGMMNLFGSRYIQWALMVTGFVIGIPLFYNTGFMLVVPLIFTVAYKYKFNAVYIGLPMLASLSVTHGFLPPHPSPLGLIEQFHADMGTTLFYGIIVAIPTVIVAGPIFSRTLRSLQSTQSTTFQAVTLPEDQLPGLGISIFSALLPVILLVTAGLLKNILSIGRIGRIFKRTGADGTILDPVIHFISDPIILMIVSLLIATYTLGVRQKTPMKKVMDIYGDAVKDIAMLLLIMSGAGALKEILIESGVSKEIGMLLTGLNVHPLFLGWSIACIIRVCVGSATVAGLTAAGLVVPLLQDPAVDKNLMVLAVGAGSLMFSHVNDAGFWLFKEYFNLNIRNTIRSWSLMETIVAVVGIIGVMILNAIIH